MKAIAARRLKTMAATCLGAIAWAAPQAAPLSQADALETPIRYEEVRQRFTDSDITVQDRFGRSLARLREDFLSRRGRWLTLAEISPALVAAVLASEDQRFFQHAGVDWRAIAAAAWDTLSRHRARGGASTISMQLASLLDQTLAKAGERDLGDKLVQVRQAIEIERHWTKSQILEAYLNLVPFRGELVGVDALAQILFRKHASGLDARESAMAAALLRGPNAILPVLTQRSCQVLRAGGHASRCEGLREFIAQRLERGRGAWLDNDELAPHFSRFALTQAELAGEVLSGGSSLRTTMDAGVQEAALSSIDRHLRRLRQANIRDAAALVLDNATGDVLAYVGSSGRLSDASHVDHVRALRQAGSALKPLLYAQALQEQRVTAASLLDNGVLRIATGNGLYVPQNYDKTFSGWVSVRTALASSLNVPAVRVLMMIGPGKFAHTLKALGLPLHYDGDYYGYSLALGSADITLFSLANAYRALANGGVASSVHVLPRQSPAHAGSALRPMAASERVFTPEAAWIVGDILADRQARARTFGLDSPLATSFWSAVKTGTSKDMRDNWALGWTEHYTVGVWVGNSSGASMQDVSGVSGAGPIWQDIVAYLHRKRPSRQPTAPTGIRQAHIVFDNGIEPPRREAFIGDTAVSVIRLAQSSIDEATSRPRIENPEDGTVLALDPDIPKMYQRLALAARPGRAQAGPLLWRINGKAVGEGPEVLWTPVRGRHHIELVDPASGGSDSVHLDVR